MIIDVHTHIPSHFEKIAKNEEQYDERVRPDKAVKTTTNIPEYFEAMEPVDFAILFGIARHPNKNDFLDELGFGDNVGDKKANVNDTTAEIAAMRPDKIIGFMSVHPDDKSVLNEVSRCKEELNLKGIKLGPNYQNFDPLGENAAKLYGLAELNKLPIVFHQGTVPIPKSPLKFSYPIYMDQIAASFPQLKIVMAHMGHPWHEDCIAVIRKHPHVYADISAQFYRPWSAYNGFRLAFEWNVIHKLLFASDWPITTPTENISFLNGLPEFCRHHNLPEIPIEPLQKIKHRNSLELLGIR